MSKTQFKPIIKAISKMSSGSQEAFMVRVINDCKRFGQEEFSKSMKGHMMIMKDAGMSNDQILKVLVRVN